MPIAIDVQELQNRIATEVDHTNSAPTAGGSKWNLRLKNLNRAQNSWAAAAEWKELYKEYGSMTSTNTANCSITLPSDFERLASYPRISIDDDDDFAEIRPEEKSQYEDTDVYCYILGNPSDGYTMFAHPGTTSGYLTSGASIYVPYYASPASLASPADKSMCPNPEYLVKQSVAYELRSLEDARFPILQTDADKELLRMLEKDNTPGEAAEHSKVRSELETKHSFRLGRD